VNSLAGYNQPYLRYEFYSEVLFYTTCDPLKLFHTILLKKNICFLPLMPC